MKWKKYLKKPIIIKAIQWFKDGDLTIVEKFRVRPFEIPNPGPCKKCNKMYSEHGWIATLEGGHIVCPGDWIIKGIEGEFYPCKPGIFEKTYEEVVYNDTTK